MHERLSSVVNDMVSNGIEFRLAVQEFEAMYLRVALERFGGNISAAAQELGLHRNTIMRKMKQLSIDKLNGGDE